MRRRIKQVVEMSGKRKNGVKVKNPKLQQAFRYHNYIESGLSIRPGELPDIVVLDLLDIIEQEKKKLEKEKHMEAERKTNRM